MKEVEHPDRLLDTPRGIPFLHQLGRDRGFFGQEVRGDIFRLDAPLFVAPLVDEADATGLHHAEKELLLCRLVALPDDQLEQGARETAVLLAEQLVAFLPVEDGIDRIQGPLLIEDDPVVEQAFPVEHDPGIVEIGEEIVRVARAVFRSANLLEMLVGDGAILALLHRHSGVRIAHGFEPLLYALPTGADGRDALTLVEPADRFL